MRMCPGNFSEELFKSMESLIDAPKKSRHHKVDGNAGDVYFEGTHKIVVSCCHVGYISTRILLAVMLPNLRTAKIFMKLRLNIVI